jgi:hypothetical protein
MTEPTETLMRLLDAAGDGRRRSDVPFDRSWWVVPGRLLAGYHPGHQVADAMRAHCAGLERAGIRTIVNLMEPTETNRDGEPFADCLASFDVGRVRSERHPVRDFSTPTHAGMAAILDTIDRSLAAGDPVYVHCWGGRGRTGTVVGCWLVRHGLDDGDAIRKIARLRRDVEDASAQSPETSAQRAMVTGWKRGH